MVPRSSPKSPYDHRVCKMSLASKTGKYGGVDSTLGRESYIFQVVIRTLMNFCGFALGRAGGTSGWSCMAEGEEGKSACKRAMTPVKGNIRSVPS